MPGEIQVADITAAVFSIAQNGIEVISKELPEMASDNTSNSLVLELTQQDTLRLNKGVVGEIQVKVKIGNNVFPSDIMRISVDRILNEEAI